MGAQDSRAELAAHSEPDGTIVLMPYTVERNYAGWRLDAYLAEKLRRLTPDRIARIISRDLVSDEPLVASTRVWPGLSFQLRRRLRDEPSVPGVEQLTEVYRDGAMLVVDKPAGLPVHPTARYQHNTLTAQLKVKYGEATTADPAHRLDRETSGLLVCGCTPEASRRLTGAFARGAVEKSYLAIVEGHLPGPSLTIDAPIAVGTPLIRVAVRIDAAGKSACTEVAVERRFERDGAPFSLVRCWPRTGRQHQIRVHLAHAGFPVVGDKMYGPDPGYFDRFSRHVLEPEAWRALRLPRHALHAATLTVPHPVSGEAMHFEAPLPLDLRTFIEGVDRDPPEAG